MSTPVASAAPVAASAPTSPQASQTAAKTTTTATSPAPSSTAPTASGGKPGDLVSAAVAKSTGNEPTAATPDAAAAKPVDAVPPKMFKVKINGEERTLNEEQLLRYASLGGGADARFSEAKQMREAAEGLVQALRTDPLSVLTHPDLGVNFRELAEQYLAKEIQREMLPPEQRELQELKAWKEQQLAAQQTQQQEQTTRAQQQQMQQLQAKAAKEYDQQITESLSRSDLPRRPETIRDVAAEMHRAMEHGYEIDVPTAVAMVRDRYASTIQSTLGNLDGESLVKTLGESLVMKIRKFDIARLKAAQQGNATPAPTPTPNETAAPRQRTPQQSAQLTPAQWNEMIRRRAGLE